MRNIMVSPEMIDEAMAHPFYASQEKTNIDQPSKHESLSLSLSPRSTRPKHQHDAMNRISRRTSPSTKDAGGKNGSAKSRTRVACDRCRKRKIKCSGDKEDGRACTNCQSAGYANCHYVRVKATLLHTKFPDWPYPGGNDATVSPASNMHMYAQHMDSKSAALQNVRVAPYAKLHGYDMDPAFGPQPYGIDNSINYDVQPSMPYNSQTTHMLPNAPQGSLQDYYGLWNKGWNANPNETVFPEQENDNTLTQSAYSYLLPNHGSRSDVPSLAPGALSTDGQGPDRTLPNPRGQLPTNFPTLAPAQEAMNDMSYSPEYRPANPCTNAVPHRGTMQNMTSEQAFTMSPGNQVKPDPEMVVGFTPTVPPMGPTQFPTDLPQLDQLEPSSPSDDLRIPSDSRLTRAYSRDSNGRLLSISTAGSDYSPATDSYNYSGGSGSSSERGRTCSEPSDASALVNALPSYSPARGNTATNGQPQNNSLPFTLLTDAALSDYRSSMEMQRNLGY